MESTKTRVLIVDDHSVVRQGLKQILHESDIPVSIGEAGSGQEALSLARTGDWDLVVLDISLPDRSGLDVLKQIKSYYPKLPVLVLTMHAEEQYAVRVLRAGAAGYLTKDSAPEEMATAVKKVAAGGRYVSSSLAEKLVFDMGGLRERPHEALSDREFQVFCMLASGERIKDIAEKLCLSVKTVSSHRARILTKMKMRNNAQLVQYALEQKLIPGSYESSTPA
jgi:two-component system, NarL family, invasion response regulator UvrY